jgi:hypothetical protein
MPIVFWQIFNDFRLGIFSTESARNGRTDWSRSCPLSGAYPRSFNFCRSHQSTIAKRALPSEIFA